MLSFFVMPTSSPYGLFWVSERESLILCSLVEVEIDAHGAREGRI